MVLVSPVGFIASHRDLAPHRLEFQKALRGHVIGHERVDEFARQRAADGFEFGGPARDTDHVSDLLDLIQRESDNSVVEV